MGITDFFFEDWRKVKEYTDGRREETLIKRPKLLEIGAVALLLLGMASTGYLGYKAVSGTVKSEFAESKKRDEAVVVSLNDLTATVRGSDEEKYKNTPLWRIEKELGEIKSTLKDVKEYTSALYKYSPEVRYTAIKTTLDKKDKDTLCVMIKDHTQRIGNWRLTGDDIAKQALFDLTGYVALDKAYVTMFDEIISEMYPEWIRGKKNGEFIFTYK